MSNYIRAIVKKKNTGVLVMNGIFESMEDYDNWWKDFLQRSGMFGKYFSVDTVKVDLLPDANDILNSYGYVYEYFYYWDEKTGKHLKDFGHSPLCRYGSNKSEIDIRPCYETDGSVNIKVELFVPAAKEFKTEEDRDFYASDRVATLLMLFADHLCDMETMVYHAPSTSDDIDEENN